MGLEKPQESARAPPAICAEPSAYPSSSRMQGRTETGFLVIRSWVASSPVPTWDLVWRHLRVGSKSRRHPSPGSPGEGRGSWHTCTHLREDVNSEKAAQPVSLAGMGSSVLQTSDPTESKGAPWVVSMGTSKLADQLGAKTRGEISF